MEKWLTKVKIMSSQQNIIKILERIAKWGQNTCPQDTRLIMGISDEHLCKIVEGFPFIIPNNLWTLYKNGYTLIDIDVDFYSFISIQESIDACLRFWLSDKLPKDAFAETEKKYLEFYEGCFKNNFYKKIIDQYPLDWCELPIGSSGGANYFIKVYKQETPVSPVWVMFKGEKPYEYASSLTNLLLAFAECCEAGAYYATIFEEDNIKYNIIEQDLEKAELIFEKYNPYQIDTWRKMWKENNQ